MNYSIKSIAEVYEILQLLQLKLHILKSSNVNMLTRECKHSVNNG